MALSFSSFFQRLLRSVLWLPWMWSLFAACLLFFWLWPQTDINLTAQYYAPGAGFYLAQQPWVQWCYRVFADIHRFFIPFMIVVLLTLAMRKKGLYQLRLRQWSFMLLLLVLGPGLVVNGVFKEHWGRARPVHTEFFGGSKHYSPPLKPVSECQSNCSFVSGHAAGAFWLLGLAFVTGRRRWLLAGAGVGGIVGLGRVLQGGHFTSDVIFAFWAVYITAVVLAACFKLPHSLYQQGSKK